MKSVLSIAGSDSSGGAGIQADIKTIAAHGLYAMTAITALTAQNTTGVQGILEVSAKFVGEQIDSVFTDIRPDAVKVGMLANAEIVAVVAERLKKHQAQNIVLDPVMVSTSGSNLLQDAAVASLQELLFPLATVVTPNIPEAEALCGFALTNDAEIEAAAKVLATLGSVRKTAASAASKQTSRLSPKTTASPASKQTSRLSPKTTAGAASKHSSNQSHPSPRPAILVKGGHLIECRDQFSAAYVSDLLYDNGQFKWFKSAYIHNPNIHGTGCTLSAAIACGLAMGLSLERSVAAAKQYLDAALAAYLDLGVGKGPLNHMPNWTPVW